MTCWAINLSGLKHKTHNMKSERDSWTVGNSVHLLELELIISFGHLVFVYLTWLKRQKNCPKSLKTESFWRSKLGQNILAFNIKSASGRATLKKRSGLEQMERTPETVKCIQARQVSKGSTRNWNFHLALPIL